MQRPSSSRRFKLLGATLLLTPALVLMSASPTFAQETTDPESTDLMAETPATGSEGQADEADSEMAESEEEADEAEDSDEAEGQSGIFIEDEDLPWIWFVCAMAVLAMGIMAYKLWIAKPESPPTDT